MNDQGFTNARIAFWAAAYLLRLHASGRTEDARDTADTALKDFDEKRAEIDPEARPE